MKTVSTRELTLAVAAALFFGWASVALAASPLQQPGGGVAEGDDPVAWTGDHTFDALFDWGTAETFTDTDATPDVSTGALWNTFTNALTITDFDGAPADGQFLLVRSVGAIVFDCTGAGLDCGSTDITTATGDLTAWLYDGVDWDMVAFMDVSTDMGTDATGSAGDNVRVEDGDNAGTFTSIDTTASFEDQGDINFAFTDGGVGGPDAITATVRADSVALTTDTTGNYAAGDAEAGAATTGDSATSFFSSGTIAHEQGGLEADVSAFGAGLYGQTAGNATINVDTEAELETAAVAGANILLETEIDASSELAAIMDDETGSGLLVFGTAPVFVTSIEIGAAVLSEAELEILDGATITTAELDTLSDASNADSLHVHAAAGITDGSIDFAEILYSNTLAANPALAVDECFFLADVSGGGIICEGSVANTNEQLYRFPNVDGADTTEFVVVSDDANVSPAEAGFLDGVTSQVIDDDRIDTAAELDAIVADENLLVETEIDASSELLAIMDDETGTGLLVFATSPTFLGNPVHPADSISDSELDEGATFNWTGNHTFDALVDVGTQTQFSDTDATPDVSGGIYFSTFTNALTITDFDGTPTDGQLLIVESLGAITWDCTGAGLDCGSTDIVTAAGDITMWVYDATDWDLISFMDVSADQGSSGGPSQATQAALEAETNEDTYAPPDLLLHNPGVAKAWVKFDIASTVNASQNVASVTDTGTGDWLINIATDFSGVDYAGVAAYRIDLGDGNKRIIQLGAQAAGTLQVIMSTGDGGNPADPAAADDMHVAMFGDQ